MFLDDDLFVLNDFNTGSESDQASIFPDQAEFLEQMTTTAPTTV